MALLASSALADSSAFLASLAFAASSAFLASSAAFLASSADFSASLAFSSTDGSVCGSAPTTLSSVPGSLGLVLSSLTVVSWIFLDIACAAVTVMLRPFVLKEASSFTGILSIFGHSSSAGSMIISAPFLDVIFIAHRMNMVLSRVRLFLSLFAMTLSSASKYDLTGRAYNWFWISLELNTVRPFESSFCQSSKTIVAIPCAICVLMYICV